MLAHYASGQLPGVRNLLWAQMIGRAFAAIVHNSMRSLPAPRPREDYYGLAINYLNLLLGTPTGRSTTFCTVVVYNAHFSQGMVVQAVAHRARRSGTRK